MTTSPLRVGIRVKVSSWPAGRRRLGHFEHLFKTKVVCVFLQHFLCVCRATGESVEMFISIFYGISNGFEQLCRTCMVFTVFFLVIDVTTLSSISRVIKIGSGVNDVALDVLPKMMSQAHTLSHDIEMMLMISHGKHRTLCRRMRP